MSLKELSNQLVVLELAPSVDWPRDAGRTVLDALRSGDPLTMERATHLAWHVLDDALAVELLEIIRSDASPEIRGSAAISLGPTLEDAHLDAVAAAEEDIPADPRRAALAERIQEVLRAAFEDLSQPKVVRRRALEASVRGPLAWHADAIGGIADSDDEDWRLTALFGMGHIEGFEDRVLDALRTATGDMLLTAVQAAEDLLLDEAGERVLELAVSDASSVELRVAAMYAIGAIRPSGSEGVIGALAQSDDMEIASVAEDVLADLEEEDWDDEDDDWDDDDEL